VGEGLAVGPGFLPGEGGRGKGEGGPPQQIIQNCIGLSACNGKADITESIDET
jgi:hypothetical protein